jgi:Uma2 family endonuclease
MQYDQWGNRIRDELIAGEIVVKPMPDIRHSIVQGEIGTRLIVFLDANPHLQLGCLFGLGTQIGELDAFAPDVCITNRNRLAEPVEFFQGALELAIEVISDTDTAQHMKRKVDVYLQRGSESVWIVFPEARSVQIYTRDSLRELKAEQVITDPLLPGFSSPVAAFFELT